MITEVYIETKKGAAEKHEIRDGQLVLDKKLPSGYKFPVNYGFIRNTISGDGDAYDVILLGPAVRAGQKYKVKLIGLMRMLDEAKEDYKAICVPRGSKLKDVSDLKEKELAKIKYFFEHYKISHTLVMGFSDVKKAERAVKLASLKFRQAKT
ncbi:MAG: inorganic diphosphatase [DPANN group archaeon]|nr:inorganic diphosphatase [DPANN group archaeon]